MRRCCANGPACASGSKRTPKGVRMRRHITQAATDGTRRTRSGRALPRRRLAAALDSTADRALDLNELEREFITESREISDHEAKQARRTNRRLRGLLAGVGILLAAALAGYVRDHPARRRARRGDGPARPAAWRPIARRGGSRSFASARPSGGRDRRLAADSQLPAVRAPALACCDRDHARWRRRPPTNRRQSGREDARRGWNRCRRASVFDAETYEQIGEPVEVPAGPGPDGGHRPGVQPRWGNARVRDELRRDDEGYLRVIDVKTREMAAEARRCPGCGVY